MASEGPPTGWATSTPSPTAGAGEGEVDAGATTSALLLPTTQEHQHCESCLAVSSNYFMCKPNNREVTLNPAPTGSLNRQILVSEGSGGPLTTEWNMCIYPELYTKEPQQPLNLPTFGTQGGTLPHRERNLSITSNQPKNKLKSKKQPKTGKTYEKPTEHLTQTSILTFIQKGEKRLNITQLTPDGSKKPNTRNIITPWDKTTQKQILR